MYKISVCDDYTEERNEICTHIKEYFKKENMEYSLSSYKSARSVMDEITAGKRSDIYFLDIIMPETDGMELAEFIRKHDKKCTIVFITSSADYAIHGYKVEALDYIVKPFQRDEFFSTLARIIHRITKTGTIVIKIKNKTGYMELDTGNIMYVESNRHVVNFYMEDGKVNEVVASLEQYAPLLTRYQFFLRCHKSYIINLNFVKEKKNDCFILKNDKIVNISRSNKAICKNKYHEFIFSKMKGELD